MTLEKSRGATNVPIQDHEELFELFATKMRAAGTVEPVIRIFHYYYRQLLAGVTGYIGANDALPIHNLPDYEELGKQYEDIGRAALSKTVFLKLNGGLGNGMGMNGPKSLVEVRDGLSFLDIIIRQVLRLRRESGIRLPLVLMNSFNTHDETMAALQEYASFTQDIPVSFMQHKKPKIWKDTFTPATWPADPEKEWCPPGHGDIYLSLLTSGMLETMLAAGYETIFVSNSDNLGATLDCKLLGYVVAEELPFLMEVAHRTAADNKGGHLSVRADGQLALRELSQCPPDEVGQFQNIERYRYFNTNNLWLHLPTLRQVMRDHDEMLELPLIRNEKPVDATDPKSPRVYQLETAMGSAISLFEGAQAIRVPRSRFIPVKKNSDLLAVRSDVYRLTEDYQLRLSPERHTVPARRPPLVRLDNRYYQLISDLTERFPYGAPSMRDCTELHVKGDVYFGKDITLRGAVRITNDTNRPVHIPDGTHISGEQHYR